MTKQTPATPLHGRRIILQGGYVFEVQHQHAEHLDVLERRALGYPRLVEALRYLLAHPGDPAQVTRGEALLRELGESE